MTGANIIFIEKRKSCPASLSYETLTRFLISRSDLQCFSHEEGCFAAGNEQQVSLTELFRRAVTVQSGCATVSMTGADIIFIEKCRSFKKSVAKTERVCYNQFCCCGCAATEY